MAIDVTSLTNRRATDRWQRTSVGDMLERLTWSVPDQEAIVSHPGAYAHPQHRRLTYRQADRIANQVANALLSRGLHRSDRVLLFCENSVEAYLTKIGIAKAGLVAVPVNPMMAPDVVAYLIGHVQPAFAVVDAELWPRAEKGFADGGLAAGMTIPVGGDVVPGTVSFEEFVAGQDESEPDVEIHADDIWQILFTSGTTAMPKGVMVSHANTYAAANGFALTLTRGVRLEGDTRICTFLPIIYHVADQIFTFSAFLAGGTLILGRRPAPGPIAEAITQERATAVWAGSPAMVNALADVLSADPHAYDVSTLRVIVYGWAALPPGTLATLKRLCGEELVAVEIFGQTETIACHRFWPDKWPETYRRTAPAQNYVGIPSPILASVVMDEDGEMLEGQPGVPGEAVYRSPTVTAGYYRDLEATEQAFRFGWFHSGDSCVYDEDGLRVMIDRYKDIVKSGGENVSSLRVEAILYQHPDVQKVAVIGLPHEHWGEAVTAVVVPKSDAHPSAEDLVSFCRERLGGHETPKRVVFVGEMPETVGGKILKYKLRHTHAALYDGEGPQLGA